MPGATRPAAPRPPFSTMRPASSRVPQVRSTRHVASTSTQTVCPRPAAAAAEATPAVHTVPQNKYAVGVAILSNIFMHTHKLQCHSLLFEYKADEAIAGLQAHQAKEAAQKAINSATCVPAV
ncbi:hypothetical protein P7K49_030301 [Saguinus oedipus]|uniref:Uncharacterized protein n=1 Tax=Saguinus oedipus TaxID=9490 RepID=A0ABQ9U1T2_SAGOE|nr:hypothetical protein P7K49_030301 [Saguinus oedipus]